MIFFVDGRQICVVPAAPFECGWDAGRTISEHQIRIVATLTAGGRVVQTLRTKGVSFADNEDVDAVQVTVTVMDGPNRFVRGLPVSAFRVFEDGRPQKISYFANTDVPLELIAAIDISGSMGPVMPKLKKAVQEFLAAVPSGDRSRFSASTTRFSRWPVAPPIPPSASRRSIAWPPGARLRSTTWSFAASACSDRQTGRKALVVFTDGEDQGSHATIVDVERGLQSSDVTLYMIGQGRGVTNAPLRAVMARLVKPTGGRAIFTENIDELRGAFGELLDELSNQYLLGYVPAAGTPRRRLAQHQGRSRGVFRNTGPSGLQTGAKQMRQTSTTFCGSAFRARSRLAWSACSSAGVDGRAGRAAAVSDDGQRHLRRRRRRCRQRRPADHRAW